MKVFITCAASDRQLAARVAELLRSNGHEVIEPSMTRRGEAILPSASAALRSSDVVVAIMSGSDSSLLYEVGLAAGANVPLLVAAHDTKVFPATLAFLPYVQLSGDAQGDARSIVQGIGRMNAAKAVSRPEFTSAEDALRAASRNPAVLELVSPAEFEDLVAKLLEARGYSVVRPSAAQDAGYDFVLTSPQHPDIVLVEVKKTGGQGRVSVDAVRQFAVVVCATGASLGMLVASSGYTAGRDGTGSRRKTCFAYAQRGHGPRDPQRNCSHLAPGQRRPRSPTLSTERGGTGMRRSSGEGIRQMV